MILQVNGGNGLSPGTGVGFGSGLGCGGIGCGGIGCGGFGFGCGSWLMADILSAGNVEQLGMVPWVSA